MSCRLVSRAGVIPALVLSMPCPALARHSPPQEPAADPAAASAPQTPDALGASARETADAPVLVLGTPVERERAGGQVHAYRVRLEAG
jgi:hypothetical protein